MRWARDRGPKEDRRTRVARPDPRVERADPTERCLGFSPCGELRPPAVALGSGRHEPGQARAAADEEEVLDVAGGHRTGREPGAQVRELIARDVELGEGPQPLAVEGEPLVPERPDRVEGLPDVAIPVTGLDGTEEGR